MLPRSESVRQSPAVTDIGVGIDTSRYRHYAAFLDADLRTAFDARCASKGDVIDLWAALSQRDVRAAALDLVHVFGLEPSPVAGTEKRNG